MIVYRFVPFFVFGRVLILSWIGVRVPAAGQAREGGFEKGFAVFYFFRDFGG